MQYCILGYHIYDFEPDDNSNGNRELRYVLDYSSWVTNGLFYFGFEDITPASRDVGTFENPFGINATPWWLSVDPFLSAVDLGGHLPERP